MTFDKYNSSLVIISKSNIMSQVVLSKGFQVSGYKRRSKEWVLRVYLKKSLKLTLEENLTALFDWMELIYSHLDELKKDSLQCNLEILYLFSCDTNDGNLRINATLLDKIYLYKMKVRFYVRRRKLQNYKNQRCGTTV